MIFIISQKKKLIPLFLLVLVLLREVQSWIPLKWSCRLFVGYSHLEFQVSRWICCKIGIFFNLPRTRQSGMGTFFEWRIHLLIFFRMKSTVLFTLIFPVQWPLLGVNASTFIKLRCSFAGMHFFCKYFRDEQVWNFFSSGLNGIWNSSNSFPRVRRPSPTSIISLHFALVYAEFLNDGILEAYIWLRANKPSAPWIL